jgi:TolB protein
LASIGIVSPVLASLFAVGLALATVRGKVVESGRDKLPIGSMLSFLFAIAVGPAVSLTAVRDAYPHLSPDNRAVVFHSNRSGRQAIWVMEAGGENPRLLFDGGALGSDPGTPVWSPDGQHIAFAMTPAGATDENESEIYVMRSGGSGVQRLTTVAGDDSHPHWSADGKRIFFNSARATPDLKADWAQQWIDIYSMASDGSDVRRHTDCRAVCTYPVPSPDGGAVAHRKTLRTAGLSWAQEPIDRNSEVFIIRLDGSGSINVSNSPAYDGWPNWSPDGRWVIFASNRDQRPNVGQIHGVRSDGTGIKRITEGLSKAQPSLSQNGKRLYFYENVETDHFELGHIASIEVSLGE